MAQGRGSQDWAGWTSLRPGRDHGKLLQPYPLPHVDERAMSPPFPNKHREPRGGQRWESSSLRGPLATQASLRGTEEEEEKEEEEEEEEEQGHSSATAGLLPPAPF